MQYFPLSFTADDKLIHLDPHYCQAAQVLEDEQDSTLFDIKVHSYVCSIVALSPLCLMYQDTYYSPLSSLCLKKKLTKQLNFITVTVCVSTCC